VNLLLLFEADRKERTPHPRSEGLSASPHPVPTREVRRAGERSEGFILTGARAEHVRSVLQAKLGEELRVGLFEGPLGLARVVSIGAEVELECSFEAEPPPRPLVDLIVAIPRPKSLKKLLPEVAALGVDRLILLRTWRVAKPYLSTAILEPAIHEPLLHEGMMQAMTTRMPRVIVEPLFKPFVEDRLPSFAGTKLVAHPYAEAPLHRVAIGANDRTVLVIGPEGGLLPYELEALAQAGCLAVNAGPRILRVETACVALLAQLSLLRAQAAEPTGR
jgi:RsmE family RNA methyltransferase